MKNGENCDGVLLLLVCLRYQGKPVETPFQGDGEQ